MRGAIKIRFFRFFDKSPLFSITVKDSWPGRNVQLIFQVTLKQEDYSRCSPNSLPTVESAFCILFIISIAYFRRVSSSELTPFC